MDKETIIRASVGMHSRRYHIFPFLILCKECARTLFYLLLLLSDSCFWLWSVLLIFLYCKYSFSLRPLASRKHLTMRKPKDPHLPLEECHKP